MGFFESLSDSVTDDVSSPKSRADRSLSSSSNSDNSRSSSPSRISERGVFGVRGVIRMLFREELTAIDFTEPFLSCISPSPGIKCVIRQTCKEEKKARNGFRNEGRTQPTRRFAIKSRTATSSLLSSHRNSEFQQILFLPTQASSLPCTLTASGAFWRHTDCQYSHQD